MNFSTHRDGLYPYLGYLIEGAGKLVYHAGDTLWWRAFRPLERASARCCHGADQWPRRPSLCANCIGCMTYQEATDLVGGLEVRLIVPAHYDMFASNSVDVSLFVDYMKVKYPDVKSGSARTPNAFPFN